jgi:hypothetical protein
MNSTTYTIGLDLGDRRHYACVLDGAGEIIAAKKRVRDCRRRCFAFATVRVRPPSNGQLQTRAKGRAAPVRGSSLNVGRKKKAHGIDSKRIAGWLVISLAAATAILCITRDAPAESLVWCAPSL